MLRKLFFPLFPFACYLLMAGCSPAPQYQEHFNVPKNSWDYSFRPEFHFEITDTAAAYQLSFLIRHTDAYAFNNIWILLDTKSPGDTVFHPLRAEIPLAANTGQWLGRGMGELYEQRMAINTPDNPAMFQKKGIYTIRMAQDMRKSPLNDVMQVGLRIEKMNLARRPG
jgi:gliding motility-associated lipoprotein GldH